MLHEGDATYNYAQKQKRQIYFLFLNQLFKKNYMKNQKFIIYLLLVNMKINFKKYNENLIPNIKYCLLNKLLQVETSNT